MRKIPAKFSLTEREALPVILEMKEYLFTKWDSDVRALICPIGTGALKVSNPYENVIKQLGIDYVRQDLDQGKYYDDHGEYRRVETPTDLRFLRDSYDVLVSIDDDSHDGYSYRGAVKKLCEFAEIVDADEVLSLIDWDKRAVGSFSRLKDYKKSDFLGMKRDIEINAKKLNEEIKPFKKYISSYVPQEVRQINSFNGVEFLPGKKYGKIF